MTLNFKGTGKTYTLVAALGHVLSNLRGHAIEVTFYEIHGKKCYDLLRQRREVFLRSDKDEIVHVRGARTIATYSPSDIAESMNALQINEDLKDENKLSGDVRGQSQSTPSQNKNESESMDYDVLVKLVQEALSLRSCEVTERNPISSRSHAVCVIKLLLPKGERDQLLNKNKLSEKYKEPAEKSEQEAEIGIEEENGGSNENEKEDKFDAENGLEVEIGIKDRSTYFSKLTLVDLAGSERNYETVKMTAVQHRESADINFSLMALKDCFRAYHAQSLGSDTFLRRKNCSPLELRSKIPGQIDTALSLSVKPMNDVLQARAPYRASPLTRVLRECFVDDNSNNDTKKDSKNNDNNNDKNNGNDNGNTSADSDANQRKHYTTIITTLSPTPTDVQHSLNSLDHVVMMNPYLHSRVHEITVEVPLLEGFLSGIPINTWTAEQVVFWVSTTNNGRFAQLVLPPGLDGKGLMKLNMVSLSALCEGQLRAARQDEEGSAWVVQGVSDEDVTATAKHNYLGRALWAALRREQQLRR